MSFFSHHLKEASSPVGCGSPSAPWVDSAVRGGGVWIREKAACLHVKEDFRQKEKAARSVLVTQQNPTHSAGQDVSASNAASCPGQPRPQPLPSRPHRCGIMEQIVAFPCPSVSLLILS